MSSFTRLRGADPTLDVEMSSTGEVACYGHRAYEVFLQALLAANFKLPEKNRSILISIAGDKTQTIYGTNGTCTYYNIGMINVKESEDDLGNGKDLSALKEIKSDKIDLLINVSDGTNVKGEITTGYHMRRAAVDFCVSLITNIRRFACLILASFRIPFEACWDHDQCSQQTQKDTSQR